MKISNKTKYDTAHIRAIVSRIAQDELSPDKRKRLKVVVVPARQQHCSTGVTNCYNWIKVTIPTLVLTDEIKLDFCATVAHEMLHVETGASGRSFEINNRRSARYGHGRLEGGKEKQREIYSWMLAMPLEHKQQPVKAPADPVAVAETKRLAIAGRIAEWQRREKRAKTALRKYRTRLKYYDRKLAAMKTSPV